MLAGQAPTRAPQIKHLVRPCRTRRQAIRRRWPCRVQEPEDSNSEGSPPGLTPEQQGGPVSTSAEGLQLPRETVTKLRSTLSHPSEFWVTSVDNYEANGVLFKGNLRAQDVQKAYASTASRLKDQIGDEWRLFLMQDKEEKPVLVVLPADILQDRSQLVPEASPLVTRATALGASQQQITATESEQRLGCITRIQLLSWVVHILTEVMLGRSHGQGLSACLGHHHSWHPAACYADLLCPAAALS